MISLVNKNEILAEFIKTNNVAEAFDITMKLLKITKISDDEIFYNIEKIQQENNQLSAKLNLNSAKMEFLSFMR